MNWLAKHFSSTEIKQLLNINKEAAQLLLQSPNPSLTVKQVACLFPNLRKRPHKDKKRLRTKSGLEIPSESQFQQFSIVITNPEHGHLTLRYQRRQLNLRGVLNFEIQKKPDPRNPERLKLSPHTAESVLLHTFILAQLGDPEVTPGEKNRNPFRDIPETRDSKTRPYYSPKVHPNLREIKKVTVTRKINERAGIAMYKKLNKLFQEDYRLFYNLALKLGHRLSLTYSYDPLKGVQRRTSHDSPVTLEPSNLTQSKFLNELRRLDLNYKTISNSTGHIYTTRTGELLGTDIIKGEVIETFFATYNSVPANKRPFRKLDDYLSTTVFLDSKPKLIQLSTNQTLIYTDNNIAFKVKLPKKEIEDDIAPVLNGVQDTEED